MIRLVSIDVDGTLLGSSGEVPTRVWDVAARARARGIRLSLCSGRPGFGRTREHAERLDAAGWHAFQNGASVISLGTGETRGTPFPHASLDLLVARARAMGRVLELYTDTDYAVEVPSEAARRHAEALGVAWAPRPFENLEGMVVRAQWLLDPKDEHAEREEREGLHELDVASSMSPLVPEVIFVNHTAKGTHKGTAVRAIASAYGCSLDEVMFVGDGENDLPALEIVGHPVAMGNAEQAVLAACRHRVSHVDHGGLADALELALSIER